MMMSEYRRVSMDMGLDELTDGRSADAARSLGRS